MKLSSCIIMAVSMAAAASVAQPNLLVNGGAESGSLAGWTDGLGNGFNTVQPGTFNAVEGSWVFTGGLAGPSGPWQHEIYQDVNVSDRATDIDAGIMSSYFLGWGRSAATDDGSVHDDASVFVEFRSGSGAVLAVHASGAIVPFNTWVRRLGRQELRRGVHALGDVPLLSMGIESSPLLGIEISPLLCAVIR
jgi:hypothetical protein